jgi:exosortase H (IPTLxxWG-CTERM-specific)
MALSRGFRFLIAFALFSIALYAIIEVLPRSFTLPINENTAWTLGMILNAFGIPVSTARDTVSGGELAFRIIPECTPIFTAGLFLSFVMFYPATPLRQKIAGLITGVPALYLGNLARLAATFMISRHNPRLFEVVHVYLGQVFTIFLVILVCIAWLKWLKKEEPGNSALVKGTGFLARFALISSGLFVVWIHIHYSYIRLLDRLMFFGFSVLDYRFAVARHTVYYYETFSIVCFTSLIFSTESLPPAMKVRGLAAGLGLLFFTHLFHRIDNVLMAHFRLTALLPVDLTLLVIGQYVLPMLPLISLVSHQNRSCLKTASQ